MTIESEGVPHEVFPLKNHLWQIEIKTATESTLWSQLLFINWEIYSLTNLDFKYVKYFDLSAAYYLYNIVHMYLLQFVLQFT